MLIGPLRNLCQSALLIILATPFSLPLTAYAQAMCSGKTGYLILSHGVSRHGGGHGHHSGGSQPSAPAASTLVCQGNKSADRSADPWEKAIEDLVCSVRQNLPNQLIELAFGMWNHTTFQASIDRLAAQGVCALEVIPLAVSSYSEVNRVQRYMFGLLEQNPLLGMMPIHKLNIPASLQGMVQFGSALNDHPLVGEILLESAQALGQGHFSRSELILVAHGPLEESDDQLWLHALSEHANFIQSSLFKAGTPFFKVHELTVRDDAPKEIWERKKEELRQLVASIAARGNQALILPVLLAPGGIQKGIEARLQGLTYKMSPRALAVEERHGALAPSPRLIQWLMEQIKTKIETTR